MTKQEFRQKIKGYYKTDDVVNYILCIVFILIGLFFFFFFLQGQLSQKGTLLNPWSLLVSAIPILFGIYGLWRIRQDYIVNEMYSNASIDTKRVTVEDYLSKVKILYQSKDGNYYSYRYRNKYFMIVDLRVYLAVDKILYNTMGGDRSALKGIIDFGLSYRASKKFQRHLNACL